MKRLVPLLLLIGVLLLNPRWLLAPVGGWLALPDDPLTPRPQSAIVALGGGGQQRLLQAITLLGSHPDDTQLWYTGNMIPERERAFIDPLFARGYAMERGVAEERIHLLQSTSTWEDALALKAEAGQTGVEHLVIVTNRFHSRRAMCVIRRRFAGSDITLTYVAPASDDFNPETWWQSEQDLVDVTEEWIKVLYYWQRYGIAPWSC